MNLSKPFTSESVSPAPSSSHWRRSPDDDSRLSDHCPPRKRHKKGMQGKITWPSPNHSLEQIDGLSSSLDIYSSTQGLGPPRSIDPGFVSSAETGVLPDSNPECISMEHLRSAISQGAALAIEKIFLAANKGLVSQKLDWEALRRMVPSKESLDDPYCKPVFDLQGFKRDDPVGTFCRCNGSKDEGSLCTTPGCGELLAKSYLKLDSGLGAGYSLVVVDSAGSRRRLTFRDRRFCHFFVKQWEVMTLQLLQVDVDAHIKTHNFDLGVWMARDVIYSSRVLGTFVYHESFDGDFEQLWLGYETNEEV